MIITWNSPAEFKELMKSTPFVPDKGEAFKLGLEQSLPEGLILEFGVKEGRTINIISSLVPNETVYGFDSFEGLPEAWDRGQAVYPKGRYKQMRLPKVNANVKLIKGWFKNTLPNFVKEHSNPVRFMNIDSDLYSSCVCILENFNKQIVPGTIINLDEICDWTDQEYSKWDQHEYKAIKEWAAKYNRELAPICWVANYTGLVKVIK